jgi:hypothetical protein
MRNLAISLVYLGFFALIGVATYITKDANCLFALLLTPRLKTYNDGKSE